MGTYCSVSTLALTPDDHDVVRQHLQQHVTLAAGGGLPASAEPRLRLIMLTTVSACQRCVYRNVDAIAWFAVFASSAAASRSAAACASAARPAAG